MIAYAARNPARSGDIPRPVRKKHHKPATSGLTETGAEAKNSLRNGSNTIAWKISVVGSSIQTRTRSTNVIRGRALVCVLPSVRDELGFLIECCADVRSAV